MKKAAAGFFAAVASKRDEALTASAVPHQTVGPGAKDSGLPAGWNVDSCFTGGLATEAASANPYSRYNRYKLE